MTLPGTRIELSKTPAKWLVCLLVVCSLLLPVCGCQKGKEVKVNSPGLLLNASTSFYDAQSVIMHSNEAQDNITVVSCASENAAYMAVSEFPRDSEIQSMYSSEKTYLQKYDANTKNITNIDITPEIGESSFVYSLTMDGKGNVYVFIVHNSLSVKNSLSVLLVHEDGTVGPLTALLLPDSFSNFTCCTVDSDGNIFLGSQGQVLIMNASGKTIGTIKNQNLTGDLYGLCGTVYGLERPSNAKENSCLIAPVNLQSCSMGPAVDISLQIRTNDSFYAGNSYLCVNTQEGVTAIDPVTGESQQALLWKNAGIDACDSQSYQLVILPDGKMLLLPGQQYLMADVQPTTYAAIYLQARQDSPLADKKELVIGGVGISFDNDLKKCISDFNKSSTDYYIVMRDYFEDYYLSMGEGYDSKAGFTEANKQMNLDILSNNAPDMLVGLSEDLLDTYQSRDLLLDLNPLIENDNDFNINKLVPHIIEELKKDGKMYRICTSFSIDGMAGAQSLFAERTGWTYDEFDAFAEGLASGKQLFPDYFTQSYLLEKCFPVGSDGITDKTQIEQLLDFSKKFGIKDTNTYSSDTANETLIESGDSVIRQANIFTPFQYRSLIGKIGENIQITGFPSMDGSGPYFVPYKSAAIMTTAKNPQVCWEFLSTLFGEEYQTAKMNTQMSMLSSVLDLQIKEAMDPDFYPKGGNWDGTKSPPLSEEQATQFRGVIDTAKLERSNSAEINSILNEEGMSYFSDQKSREEVASIISNRISTLIEESG